MLLVPAVVVVALLSSASGQTTHTVMVGQLGSFYDPPTLTALVNDTVEFLFSGIFHGVTQSTFDSPCLPLAGGFSSGLAGTLGNTSIGPPVWNLKITNVSQPIYFFCEATQPESHCEAGMVGAINAEPDMFTSFQAAAKLVTGTPMPTPTLILSGVGAFATAGPSTPLLTSTASSSSSGSSTTPQTSPTDTTPSPTPSSSKSSVSVGVLAGAIAGSIAVVIIAILVYLLLRSKRQRKSDQRREANIISAVRALGDRDRFPGDRNSFPGPGGQKAGYVSPDPSDADSLGYNRIGRGDAYYTTAGTLPQMANAAFGAPVSRRDRDGERERERFREYRDEDDRDVRDLRGAGQTTRTAVVPTGMRRGMNRSGDELRNESVNDINESAMASLARNPTYAEGIITSSTSGTTMPSSTPISHPYNNSSSRPTTSESQSTASNVARVGMPPYASIIPPAVREEEDDDVVLNSEGHAAPRYASPPPPPHMPSAPGPAQPANVHEIAKEVAALLGPRLRSPPPPHQPPPPLAALSAEMPEVPGQHQPPSMQVFGSVQGRQRRELPNPHRFSPSSVPPEYES